MIDMEQTLEIVNVVLAKGGVTEIRKLTEIDESTVVVTAFRQNTPALFECAIDWEDMDSEWSAEEKQP